jgi:hypothetical protein
MDFNVSKIRLPAPVNIHISYPKLQGHLMITWNMVNNPDKNDINGNIGQNYYIKTTNVPDFLISG